MRRFVMLNNVVILSDTVMLSYFVMFADICITLGDMTKHFKVTSPV